MLYRYIYKTTNFKITLQLNASFIDVLFEILEFVRLPTFFFLLFFEKHGVAQQFLDTFYHLYGSIKTVEKRMSAALQILKSQIEHL